MSWLSKFLICRPQTLPVSMAPVVVAGALSSKLGHFSWLPFLLCLLFAVFAQITANLVNEYADFIRGDDKDPERKGPRRALVEGEVSATSIRNSVIITGCIAVAIGCSLISWGGWWLLPVGIVIMLSAYAYSGGPFPLSRHALGDVAVIIFFGIVPVTMTAYILGNGITMPLAAAGLAIGLVVDNLLIVNNYRDEDVDKRHGKKTTVTLFGRPFMRLMFLLNPFFAMYLGFYFLGGLIELTSWSYLCILFVVYVVILWKMLGKRDGEKLNILLPLTSLLALFYALLIVFV